VALLLGRHRLAKISAIETMVDPPATTRRVSDHVFGTRSAFVREDNRNDEVSVANVARTLCAAEPVRKAASVGAEKVRTTIASENDCRLALVQLMKAQRDNPIAKSELRKRFPQVSARGWNRAYLAAATEANAPAWSAPGRRPKKS
jgi:hypothetical protein